MRIGTGAAEGAEQRQSHDDIAEPIRKANPKTRATLWSERAPFGEIAFEQIAFREELKTTAGDVLISPAVMAPEPGGADVVIFGERIFECAVECEGHAGGSPVMRDGMTDKTHAPKAAAHREK